MNVSFKYGKSSYGGALCEGLFYGYTVEHALNGH